MVPYFTMSIFYLLVQFVVQSVATFKRPIDLELLLNILVRPEDGPMGPLWFLYVLFEVQALSVALLLVLGRSSSVLGIAIILSLFAWPQGFGLASAFHYLFFFVAGRVYFDKSALQCWNPRLGLTVASTVFWAVQLVPDCLKFALILSQVLGLAGIFASIYLVRILEEYKHQKVLAKIGRYSMAIYVLHMLIITVAFHMVRAFGGIGLPFSLLMMTLFAAIVIPVSLVKYGREKSPLLTRLVVGTAARNA